MRLGYTWILAVAIMTSIFSGCRSDSNQAALPPEMPDSNTLPNEPSNNGKEKLLDMAIKMSGADLPPEKRGKALRMLSLNEKDVIRGLGVWLELLDGRYPKSLEPKVAIKQADSLLAAKYGSRKQANKEKKKEIEGKVYDIFFASAFYDKLIREKKDVAYYGHKITVEDSSKILMRWKISNDRYRVIYGDLSIKEVTEGNLPR